MTAEVFSIGQGDSSPQIEGYFRRSDGTAIDVSGATLTFFMKAADGTLKVNGRTAVEVDGPTGHVRYSWQTDGSDTNVAGNYRAWFRAVFAAGGQETAPNSPEEQLIVEVTGGP